jgi:hypothetical protein
MPKPPAPTWEKSSAELVAFFESLAPREQGIVYKKMFGYPACFVHGYLFVSLFRQDLLFRLSPADFANFLKLDGTGPFEPMPGRRSKGYAILTEPLRRDPKLVAGRSYAPWNSPAHCRRRQAQSSNKERGESQKMNWKLILQLSMFGLVMGLATVFVIPSNIEPLFWLVIFVICAYIIAKQTQKPFLRGLLLGLANSVWITAAHILLFQQYIAIHARAMSRPRHSYRGS